MDIFPPDTPQGMTNSKNSAFNAVAAELLMGLNKSRKVKVWSSGRTLSEKLVWETEAELHDNTADGFLSENVYSLLQMQLLLNYLFNDNCRR